MTMQDAVAASKLSFRSAFRTTFGTVFGELWSFVKAALLPLAISIALAIVGIALLATGEQQTLAGFVLEVLGLLPLVVLGIACSRLALIGSRSGAIPRPLFGRRTFVYLGYTVLFSIAMALPVMGFGIIMLGDAVVTMATDPEAVQIQSPAMLGAGVFLLFVFYLAYLYFILRFSLVFPAVAVDRKLGLRGSWQLTRGTSGFKLYALLIVIALLCLVATLIVTTVANTVTALLWLTPVTMMQADGIDWGMVALNTAPSVIIGLVAEFFSFLLLVVAIASAFAQLTGWGAPRQEVLERFE